MPLNDLSLEELTELGKTIALLVVTGEQLQRSGFTPTFDLTPGAPTRIILPPMMPKISEPSPVETFLASRAEYLNRQMAERFPASTEAAPTPGGVVASSLPEPVDPPPAVEGPAGGDPIPSAPEQSVAGLPETATPVSAPQIDPLPVAAGSEGSGGEAASGSGSTLPAATHQEKMLPATWTAEEDARLISLIANGMVRMGLGKTAAIRAAAAELGRPEPGTAFRCHHKLKARIDAALTEAAMDQAQTETPDAGEPPSPIEDEADVEPGQREAETTVRAAASIEGQLADAADLDAKSRQSAIAHGNGPEPAPDLHGLDLTLWHFLHENRPRWPLTWATDLDLVEALARGEKLPVISADLGIDAGLLKNRFHILTNHILDPRGNPTIDGQRRLIEILRRIADASQKAA